MLSILDIIEDTTVDGPGFRTSIYAAGKSNGRNRRRASTTESMGRTQGQDEK